MSLQKHFETKLEGYKNHSFFDLEKIIPEEQRKYLSVVLTEAKEIESTLFWRLDFIFSKSGLWSFNNMFEKFETTILIYSEIEENKFDEDYILNTLQPFFMKHGWCFEKSVLGSYSVTKTFSLKFDLISEEWSTDFEMEMSETKSYEVQSFELDFDDKKLTIY